MAVHKPEQNVFIVDVHGELEPASLSYRMVNDKIVDFYRTFVPPSQRGSQPPLGMVLGTSAMNWAKSNNLQTQLSCGYLMKKFKDDEAYKSMIVVDVDESKL